MTQLAQCRGGRGSMVEILPIPQEHKFRLGLYDPAFFLPYYLLCRSRIEI